MEDKFFKKIIKFGWIFIKTFTRFLIRLLSSFVISLPSIAFFVFGVTAVKYLLKNYDLSKLNINLGTGILISILVFSILIITAIIQFIFIKTTKRYKHDVDCENIKFLEEAIEYQKKKRGK